MIVLYDRSLWTNEAGCFVRTSLKGQPGNLKIGVLIETRPSAYSRDLRKAVKVAATDRGVGVVFFPTGWVSTSGADSAEAVDGSLAELEGCDGILLFSAVFSDAIRGISRLVQHWLPRPIVSIGYRLPGVDSLLVDNLAGAQMATEHLVAAHGRQKILFIRGRRDSQEAEKRYLGYRHGLRTYRILHDDRLVLDGDFTAETATRILRELSKEVEYDAIICANDDMALAALEFVRKKGLRVPEDVSLIGFDDVPEARRAIVPLATLAQPFEKLAAESVALLMDRAAGVPREGLKTVPVDLILRRSCGCT